MSVSEALSRKRFGGNAEMGFRVKFKFCRLPSPAKARS